jgi:hypothetical protein
MYELVQVFQVPLEVDAWDHNSWRTFVAGLEKEPEKGKRCLKCFEFSFNRTHLKAMALGIPAFTSTLSISPHKPAGMLFAVGALFPGFQAMDFKKKMASSAAWN